MRDLHAASIGGNERKGTGWSAALTGTALNELRVRVAVVQVRVVRMSMCQWRMHMPMRMRPTYHLSVGMLVLMMFVVHMTVLMVERVVCMLVAVPFGQMQV